MAASASRKNTMWSGKFRETRLYQVAPISTNLILAYLGEHVLGMPRSY
jgi:acyl-CoA dehydrogenase